MKFHLVLKMSTLLAVTLSIACQGYPFAYKGAASSVVTHSSVVVGQSNKTDILFVIDNSGSMQDKQDNLKRNAAAFIAELAKSDNSYHLGIVTTDLLASTDGGRLRDANATTPPYFWSAPSASDPAASDKRQTIVTQFENTVASLGIQGSSNEAALGAALAALSTNDANVLAHNAGFLRDDADLAIIIVSDEDDCSPLPQAEAQVATWTQDVTCYVHLEDLYPVDALVDMFAALKNHDVGRLRVGLISGGVKEPDGSFVARGCRVDDQGHASDACGCWSYSTDPWFCSSSHNDFNQPCQSLASCAKDTCPSTPGGTCDTPTCPATPARRYVSFVNTVAARRTALGFASGVLADSICQNDYHQTLLDLANQVVLSNCFNLAAAALDANDIRVTLRRAQNDGSLGPEEVVPRFEANNPNVTCQTCGGCPQGAWQYVGAHAICLACGLTQQPGDDFEISVLTSLYGNLQ